MIQRDSPWTITTPCSRYLIHPSGAPAFDRILRILFSEEEAAMAVQMSFTGKTAEEIAQRSGADVKVARGTA